MNQLRQYFQEKEKRKAEKRYAQEKRIAVNRYRWWVRNAQQSSAVGEILYSLEIAPGHFRKQHPMDCGKALQVVPPRKGLS